MVAWLRLSTIVSHQIRVYTPDVFTFVISFLAEKWRHYFTSMPMFVANIPHAGLIHTISPFFLWELMDASYIGSMPTMQNHAKILLQCLQRDLVICWFPAQKREPVAGDMVNPFHPKKGATNRSVWQPSPSSCQNHFLLFKSKHVRGEIQTCVVSCR